MNIGINAIYLEGRRTGIGRYLQNVLKYWAQNYPDNKYYLYFRREIPTDDFLSAPQFIKRLVPAPKILDRWIFWENLYLPRALKQDQANLDWFYSPSYTIPIINPVKKTAVAIFDIYYTVHPEWVPFKNRYTQGPLSKYAARKADLVICASEFDKNDIVKYYNVPESKVKVMYLAAEDKFKPKTNDSHSDIFTKYKIKSKYILCLGHIINRRVQDQIIRAFGHLSQSDPNLSLVLVGQNRTCPFIDIQQLINENNHHGGIVWIDYLPEEDMLEMYQNATGFIYLTLYEGESIPVREAMACGVPVITSKILQEVTADAAEYVQDPNNAAEIFTAMGKVITDQDLRLCLADLGLKRNTLYTWQKCADDTMKHFMSF
ncbi:TPA: hypothetical protein DF272_03330 [Candidatus Falkowbacteria bacterium]|nr:hypothetical protein [Candidatus Falkowbacteria bacterium]